MIAVMLKSWGELLQGGNYVPGSRHWPTLVFGTSSSFEDSNARGFMVESNRKAV
jgi:hypothetical protein